VELIILAFVITAVLAPLYVTARSRMRVRALMAAEADAPRRCTIPRPRVEKFHADTRVLQGLVEGLVEQMEHGYEDRHAASLRIDEIGNYSRALAEWLRSYEAELDDDDRAALGDRGFSDQWLSSLREVPDADGKSRLDVKTLRRHASELARLEALMSQTPPLSGYR
jgi:hypothetical protein